MPFPPLWRERFFVVRLAVFVVVEELHKLLGVEEFLRDLAGELLPDDVVVLVLPEPYPEGDEESEFFPFCPVHGDFGQRSGTEGFFGLFSVHAVAALDTSCQFPHFFVQVGNPKLQGVSHGHLVCLQQNIMGQPQMHVQEQFLVQVVLIPDLVEVGLCHILVTEAAFVSRSQHFVCLFVIHDKCLADVGILHGGGVPFQEVQSPVGAFAFRPVSQFLPQGSGNDFPVYISGFAGLIGIVPAEHLIGAFPA